MKARYMSFMVKKLGRSSAPISMGWPTSSSRNEMVSMSPKESR